MKNIRLIILCLVALAGLVPIACTATEGNISGNVANSQTGQPLAGVIIRVQPPLGKARIETGQNGAYSITAPQGIYTVIFQKEKFNSAEETVTITAGQKITLNTELKPIAVSVNAGQDQTSQPGSTITLKVDAEPRDGSIVMAYEWSQLSGVKASLANQNSDTVKVTLADFNAYKKLLLDILNPENRSFIQPINPYALTAAQTATFTVSVTTSSGRYSDSVTVGVDLPFVATGGIANVPVGVPVLVHGKNQADFNWQLTLPAGSKAILDNVTDQNPYFTPDVTGKYTVREGKSGFTVDIYAGTWVGAITGRYRSGNPLTAGCTGCHNGVDAPDKFASWRASGHAAVFKNSLNSSTIYGEQCFNCHTVGFNKNALNGGFDNAPDYENFLNSGRVGKPNSSNWDKVLENFPRAAKLANVQCENCHGPNAGSVLHPNLLFDAERTSISSGVCGTCHGQPQGYGRLQQWEKSGHSHFELALEEATVESRRTTAAHCGRCHSGQGFLTWIQQGNLTAQLQGANGNASVDELKSLGLTNDSVEPQTCAVCHDPHQPGKTLDQPRTVTRMMGSTGALPSGFEAKNVGYGAMCITCHNTRNGLHNDANPPTNFAAPHTAAQGDILMGENAYLIGRSLSPHAKIADSCTACHMETTYPPLEASFEPSGKNHSFKANLNVCATCHGNRIDAEALKSNHEKHLAQLADKIGEYLMKRLPDEISVRDYTPHEYTSRPFDMRSEVVLLRKDNIVIAQPTDSHGQQGFLFKLRSPVSVTYSLSGQTPHTIQTTEIQVQIGDITVDGKTPLIPVSDVLIRVGWNYHLVHYGSSNGIHNPTWVNNLIDASLNALASSPNVK